MKKGENRQNATKMRNIEEKGSDERVCWGERHRDNLCSGARLHCDAISNYFRKIVEFWLKIPYNCSFFIEFRRKK